MTINLKQIKDGNNYLYFEDEIGKKLYKAIESGDYKTVKVFKDDQRSYVALIEIDGENYVYKEPREKNRRGWQRFLSIFRGSESKREFQNIEKIGNEKNEWEACGGSTNCARPRAPLPSSVCRIQGQAAWMVTK